MSVQLTLRTLPQSFGVARLDAGTAIPRWASSADWFSITRTKAELSIVCAASAIPSSVRSEKQFRAIAVDGPLDFALTGVLASLTTPLAKVKISIFAVSTFDTDYLLVREKALPAALRALRAAGHRVIR